MIAQLEGGFAGKFGALQELEKSSRFLGNVSFSGHFGARDTIIALAALDDLEDSAAKRDLMRNLFQIDWRERDGRNAKNGDIEAQAKIYQAIYYIARFYNATNPSHPVDLELLSSAIGLRSLIHKVRGTTFTLLNDAERKVFMARDGAFEELDFVSDALLDSATFESEYGMRDAIFKLASYLNHAGEDENPGKESALLIRLKKIDWGAKDGGTAKRGGKNASGLISAQDRAYEGIYQIGEEFNRRFPDKKVSLNTLYKAKTFRAMYETLTGGRNERLPEEARVIFMSEQGAFQALRNTGRALGVRSFRAKYGARDVIFTLAESDELKDGPEKDDLRKRLNDIRWGAHDGGNAMKPGGPADGIASNTGGAAQDRIFTAIVLIAKIYNAQHPHRRLRIDTLFEAESFERLVQRLGFGLGD